MPWVKGQSGNPGGRPKAALSEFRERCREWLASGGLESIVAKATKAGPDQRWAMQLLVEYGLGKPVSRVAGEDDGDPIKVQLDGMGDEAILGRLAELTKDDPETE